MEHIMTKKKKNANKPIEHIKKIKGRWTKEHQYGTNKRMNKNMETTEHPPQNKKKTRKKYKRKKN